MKDRTLHTIIIILVLAVIISTFTLTQIFGKMNCEEKGGKWIGLLGCSLDESECRAVGGTPVGCMDTTALKCYPECKFR